MSGRGTSVTMRFNTLVARSASHEEGQESTATAKRHSGSGRLTMPIQNVADEAWPVVLWRSSSGMRNNLLFTTQNVWTPAISGTAP